MRLPFLFAAAAVSVATGVCCCCCGDPLTPEQRAAYEKARVEREALEAEAKEEAVARVPVITANLKKAASWIDPDAPIATVACPVDAIRASLGLDGPAIFAKRLWFTSYESLPGAAPFGDGKEAEFAFLDDPDVKRFVNLDVEKPDRTTLELLGTPERRYLVVFVAKGRAAPGKVDKGWVSSGFDEPSICFRNAMLTAPSGPITEISAFGHATMRSG